MMDFQTMRTAKAALDAFARKDWDALASMILPLLPALPSDGTPQTETELRRNFRRVLPQLQFPAPLFRAAERYMEAASDAQLRMIHTMVETLARELGMGVSRE